MRIAPLAAALGLGWVAGACAGFPSGPERDAAGTPGPGRCANGLDDDGDGLADELDPGCEDALDPGELYRTFAGFRVNAPALTVLVVVDDTSSMCQEQLNLRNSAMRLVEALRAALPALPFHVGVVSGDTSDPATAGRLQNEPVTIPATGLCPTPPPPLDCTTGLPSPLPKWIDESTAEPERVLGCLLTRGTGGFGAETPLGAARMALSPALSKDPTANAGFLIRGSALLVLFVGNEDDCSVCDGDVCTPLPAVQFNLDCSISRVGELTPVEDFVRDIDALRGADPTTFSFAPGLFVAAFLGLDEMGNSTGPLIIGGGDELVPICSIAGGVEAAPAPRLEGFVRSFSGRAEYDVCDLDFSNEMSDLGARIAGFLSAGCLPLLPCEGITADDVVLARSESNEITHDFTLGLDGACPSGWSVRAPALGTTSLTLAYPPGPGACP